MTYNIVRNTDAKSKAINQTAVALSHEHLTRDGWVLLRGFDVDMDSFSQLTREFCTKITFDPARVNSDKNTQKVDAGLGPIGLHIENGNTPVCPEIVAFYCEKAAFEGSQTTLCDGVKIYQAFDEKQKQRWAQKMTVERNLPEEIWKRYLVNEHPALNSPDQIRQEHILQFQTAIPDQHFELLDDGSINYALDLSPVRKSAFSEGISFANAVLGPSHNYEPPRYSFEDGSVLGDREINELRELAEKFTVEIN